MNVLKPDENSDVCFVINTAKYMNILLKHNVPTMSLWTTVRVLETSMEEAIRGRTVCGTNRNAQRIYGGMFIDINEFFFGRRSLDI